MEWKLKSGGLWDNALNLVFTNEIGQPLLDKTVYVSFKKVVEKIGSPETRFHDLRHSYATMALKSGDDLKTVSDNLGHASIKITADVYAFVTDQMKQESASRMESFIRSVSG